MLKIKGFYEVWRIKVEFKAYLSITLYEHDMLQTKHLTITCRVTIYSHIKCL